MFGLNKIREDISRLRSDVNLLRENQKSDTYDWWCKEMGCYIRRKRNMYHVMFRSYFGSDPEGPRTYEHRTPDTLEWKDVGPDFSEAIAEIEAEGR